VDTVLKNQMDKVFYPVSVAVVGVSERVDSAGTLLLRSLLDMGFAGSLYPVNPRYGKLLGLTCYPSIGAIDKPPDMVILSVPPETVPGVISECVAAGVAICVVNTAGFSETGTSEGAVYEQRVLDAIEGSSLRLVGPNCMGIYSSGGGLALFGGMRPEEGRVSFLSQSGSLASMLYMLGAERGIMFSKMASSGNELDLNSADFLEYFAEDPETEIIVAYLEQVRDPRRFLEAAVRIKGEKPLLVWKAGLTDKGRQAASSHTGAITGSAEIWKAVVRKAGLVVIDDLADAVDALSAFYHLRKPRGRRVCVVSPPGGVAVNSADAAERNRLPMPTLSPDTVRKLAGVLPGVGTSFSNPVDMGFGAVVPGNMGKVIEIAASDPEVDVILVVGGAPGYREGDPGLMKMHSAEIAEAFEVIDKPLMVIGIPSGFAFPFISELSWKGIPSFLSPSAAFRALSRYLDFYGL
jgi:acyl-CoA synthetase (NDP forming)